MKEVFIHIGLTKTGSSFLQNEIFQKNSKVNYLGKWKGNYPDWLIKLSYLDEISFENNFEQLSTEIRGKLSNKKPNLISSESFSRVGGVSLSQAQRIKKVFPDAKIIIVLRHPISHLKSFYKYSVENFGFWRSLEDSIDWVRTPLVFFRRNPFSITDYYYDELLSVYYKTFGRENICVLKYETLLKDPAIFFERLSGFINCDWSIENYVEKQKNTNVNVSPCDKDIAMLRADNFMKIFGSEVPSLPEIEVVAKRVIEEFSHQEVLSEKLVKKIESHLKGRCYGYI